MAEAGGRREEGVSGLDLEIIEGMWTEGSLGKRKKGREEGAGAYPGATQLMMTLLELRGERTAICLIMKISSSFETL